MNQQSENPTNQSDGLSGSGAASCSRSFEMPLDAALEFADSGESTGGIMTHEALKTLAASIRMMSENPKCLCGEDSTGWTEVKCCNICGLPHKNDPGDPKHERWLRYQTLDGDATGWRQEGSIRPLASEQDWHDLKNAQFTHKLEMARQFTEENAELTRPEPHDKSHE